MSQFVPDCKACKLLNVEGWCKRCEFMMHKYIKNIIEEPLVRGPGEGQGIGHGIGQKQGQGVDLGTGQRQGRGIGLVMGLGEGIGLNQRRGQYRSRRPEDYFNSLVLKVNDKLRAVFQCDNVGKHRQHDDTTSLDELEALLREMTARTTQRQPHISYFPSFDADHFVSLQSLIHSKELLVDLLSKIKIGSKTFNSADSLYCVPTSHNCLCKELRRDNMETEFILPDITSEDNILRQKKSRASILKLPKSERALKEGRESKDSISSKDVRLSKDGGHSKSLKDGRPSKDEDKSIERKLLKDHKSLKERKTIKDDGILSKEEKESKVKKSSKDEKLSQEVKGSKVRKSSKEETPSKEAKETKVRKTSKDEKPSKEGKESKDRKSSKDDTLSKEGKESKVRKSSKDEKPSKDRKSFKDVKSNTSKDQKTSKSTNDERKEETAQKPTKEENESKSNKGGKYRKSSKEDKATKSNEDLKKKMSTDEKKSKSTRNEIVQQSSKEEKISKLTKDGTSGKSPIFEMPMPLMPLKQEKPEKEPKPEKPHTVFIPPMLELPKKEPPPEEEPRTSESTIECDTHRDEPNEMIIGAEVVPFDLLVRPPPTRVAHESLHVSTPTRKITKLPSIEIPTKKRKGQSMENIQKGVIRYKLSDREFIDKGWTVLPTEKMMRRMNIYKMEPTSKTNNWFERHKYKKIMFYDSGEKLAEIDEDGTGRWYYKNGIVALNYYNAEDLNVSQRYLIYSSGEEQINGVKVPISIMAAFDYIGNGVVYDYFGNERLKYNQSEGSVIDSKIGPPSRWHWHSLNEPAMLQPVFIDTLVKNPDPDIARLMMSAGGRSFVKEPQEEMLAIEFDNFVKEKSHKLLQKFKPYEIRMKVIKINTQFSLRVLNQANIYLMFREGSTCMKLNVGMVLKSDEIVDTEASDISCVITPYDQAPPKTQSLADIQNTLNQARQIGKIREHRQALIRQC